MVVSRFTPSFLCVSIVFVLFVASCSGGDSAEQAAPDSNDSAAAPEVQPESSARATGTVIVTVEDTVMRISADGTTTPVDLSASLDEISLGGDQWVVQSRNGQWLALDTERFGCEDWSCLVVASSDLAQIMVVDVADELVHPQDWGAVDDNGSLVVITTDAGPHGLDLAVLRRDGDDWSAPLIVTGDSPHTFNERGRISLDGSAVLFDCGPTQYGLEGTGVCLVSLDGTGFEQLVDPGDGVGASSTNAARSADLALDGSIVFEADWGDNERLWRKLPNGELILISGLGNDNSPCVLPDGSVMSLWLSRDGNDEGLHELKVNASDSADYELLLVDVDVIDVGIHCGE